MTPIKRRSRWAAITRVLALGAALGVASAAPLRAESLGEALVNAYNHSGLLEQNRALLRAADEDVAIAVAALRPIINWSGQVRRRFGESTFTSGAAVVTDEFATDTASIGLSIDLLIFDGGRSQLAIDAAKENVLATRQALRSVEQQVLLRAVRAYMNLRRAFEVVALRQSNVRLITQELRAAQDRFEVGEVTRTDVALAEARLAAARSALAGAQGDAARAREEYRAAVGQLPGQVPPPAALPQTARSLAEAQAIALQRHPEMKRAQHEVALAEINLARANRAFKPTVNLSAGFNAQETFDSEVGSRTGEIALSASGPIYQGGRLPALSRQAQARRDAARAALHVVSHAVQQDVADAWAVKMVARAGREASDRQIRAATVAFRGVREEATLGARTTLDVLNAEQELLDARAGLISAIADEYIASYTLLAAMGLLTVDHLNLPVQRYDPSAYYNLVKDAPSTTPQGRALDRVLNALGKN